MQLTLKQEEGLKVALERYRHHEKYTVISGYAGTGKSTLVRFIIEALEDFGILEEDVVYTAYTGKATQILAQKGNKNVCTLHKLLFDFYARKDGTFYKKPKKQIDYHVVVVDEVSMAPKSFMDLLFSHNCYVICLGDPAQLPPINKDEDNHLLDNPQVFLDEIIRQAQESEIIRLTMDIRNHNPIRESSFKEDVKIINQEDLSTGMLEWADQVLVATNKTRIQINRWMRKLRGFTTEYPQEGDKVICLRNYWEILSDQENSLINGIVGWLQNPSQSTHKLPTGEPIEVTIADFKTDTGDMFYDIDMDTHMIMTGDKCVDGATAYRWNKDRNGKRLIPYEFAYGYAITTHKAQGSAWPKVLVIEESFPFDRTEHARWVYTAATRASEKLVLVR